MGSRCAAVRWSPRCSGSVSSPLSDRTCVIDRAQRRDAALRRVVSIAIVMTISVVIFERAGFVVVASGLFWVTARSFDSTHPWRDAGWAATFSICAYLLFARLLELPLPAGMLGHWQ